MRRLIVSTALIGLLTANHSANADLLSGYVEIHAGGASGTGLFGDLKNSAFHSQAEGVTYGGLVGVEVAFLDVWVEHNQYVSGSKLEGTWTQFMTGLDIEFDLGPKRGGTLLPKTKRYKGGYSQYYGEFGFAVGFGVGTGQQVDPPLDISELTDRGFIAQASIGGGIRLTRLFSLGLSLPMQAGYLLKTNTPANDISTNYGSMQAALLLNARFKLQIK